MSNRHVTKAMGMSPQGNIEEALKTYSMMASANDGENYYSVKEISPITVVPCTDNDEIEVRITDSDFHVMQLHDSFISLTLEVGCTCPGLTGQGECSFHGMDVRPEYYGQEFGICLRDGSCLIKEMVVTHRGKTMGATSQNNATIEGFVNNLYKPKSEKNNRKHVHSLYECVHNRDNSICGTYIHKQDLCYNGVHKVEIPVSIPIDDLLCFSGFRDYPNELFGGMTLKFRINREAFMHCQVNPHKSVLKYCMENRDRIGENSRRAIKTILMEPETTFEYTRGFTQVGTPCTITQWTNKYNGGDGSYSIDDLENTNNFVINVASCDVKKCTVTLAGYRASRQTLHNLREYYTNHPFVVPAQRVEPKAFGTRAEENGFNNCQTNIPLNHVTDFVLLFPKDAKQITCFENPMLYNLQLTVGNRNLPEKPLNTTDHVFFQMMINASDLDSLFEATDEYENSLTTPRASKHGRLHPMTDLTAFATTLQVERSGGTDIYFDGIDSNGENVSIELRGTPIYKGTSDTYYNVNAEGTKHPPPPILCTVQDSFWIFTCKNGGEAYYIKDNTFQEVIDKII